MPVMRKSIILYSSNVAFALQQPPLNKGGSWATIAVRAQCYASASTKHFTGIASLVRCQCYASMHEHK